MKKQLMLLWMSLYPVILLAQISAVSQETLSNSEINPASTHQILFELRSDLPMELPGSRAKLAPAELFNHDFSFDPDTTWSYDEMADHNSTLYYPTGFSQTFDIGTTNDFTRNIKTYNWDKDSARWDFMFSGIDWIRDMRIDSTINMRLDTEGTPTYGDKYVYIYPPSEDATKEIFTEVYRQDSGWKKNTRNLSFESEDNSKHWSKTFRYDEAVLDYVISNENYFEEMDDHTLYEYKSYTGGQIHYWNRHFQQLDEHGEVVYSVTHNLNDTKDGLVPSDSSAFIETDDFAEAKGFYYENGEWVLDTYSRTYDHASVFVEGQMIMDSVITYDVVHDQQADSMIVGEITHKTIYINDGMENLIEILSLSRINNEMTLMSKNTIEYALINNDYFETVNRYYQYSYSLGSLFLQSEWHTLLDESGELAGDMNFYFTEDGDTTNGYKSLMYFDEESFYSLNFEWSPEIHDFVKTGFMMHDEGSPITQYAYFSTHYTSDRSIIVQHSMPAAVNPGPLFAEIGDTLDIIISAYNPDMTIPTLTVENLPTSATFDPETRRLLWIVDEDQNKFIDLTATNNSKSTTIEVAVIVDEFGVSTESDSEEPATILLHQNYPNPFNPSTTISFELYSTETVTLQVFNLLGQVVETLVNGEQLAPGLKQINFNAKDLSSGVYFYRLDAGDVHFTKKMALIK